MAAGWSGFFVWSRLAELGAADAAGWSRLIADWALPVLLIAVAWLVAMRSSRREAARFGDAAQALSRESALLEQRLTTVNRELSLAREFIAAQSRDLEALGRIAAERLSQNAGQLQSLIHDNGARVDAIGTVSAAALENMEKLRGQLPVIASAAKDVTNNIASAGRTAHAQVEDMVGGFRRINEFGQASERQVLALRDQVDTALAALAAQCDQLNSIAAARFAALTERSGEFRTRLDSDEVEALAGIRTRAAALAGELAQTRDLLDGHEADALTSLRARMATLHDEGAAIARSLSDGEGRALAQWRQAATLMEETVGAALGRVEELDSQFSEAMAARRAEAEARETAALAAFDARDAAFDGAIAERQAAAAEHAGTLAAQADAAVSRLGEIDGRFAAIVAHGGEAEARVAATLGALDRHLAASRTALSGADAEIMALTDASVRLLELIQASVEHSRDHIPRALAAGEASLARVEERVLALLDSASGAAAHGDRLARAVGDGSAAMHALVDELGAAQTRLNELGGSHVEHFERVREALVAIETQNAAVADAAQASASDVAGRIGAELAETMARALQAGGTDTAGRLEAAVVQATAASRNAAAQFRDQLAKIDELAGNLERRVSRARERAEEQVDNEFARRAALITEALDSHAIDIAKALSSEVSDTAWAAYLRGDRGVFTRRAVSLIETGDARAIAAIHENDRDFRELVNRYIHDFEAILRQVLSTRDGKALGVTLLSSDMGKLYVALAQAIERLRN